MVLDLVRIETFDQEAQVCNVVMAKSTNLTETEFPVL